MYGMYGGLLRPEKSAKKPVEVHYWYDAWWCGTCRQAVVSKISDSGHSGSRAPGSGRWTRQAVTTRQGAWQCGGVRQAVAVLWARGAW